ncbi:uncharacterized protein LOC141792176 [Halichoeres trimaculatus]|uniref:uncharacterized protein LOC141792176 n=1 Tax=Halichoeres trimaculatus TaxID=147232 RepID=UPI003D9DEFB8
MSLGSSDMAGSVLVMASCLLLLASIIQGIQDEVFYQKKIEALVGQNVTLPCFVKNTDVRIASVEWRKMPYETKLVLHSPRFGTHYFWPNVTIQTESKSLGSLQISRVSKWDSGVYVCDLATFPLGSIRRETQLEVKDVEIKCDANRTVEVHAGGNVSIHCSLFPGAQYSWTKDKKLVSGKESLVLWQVTEAHTGVYTLAVNTGAESVYKEFIIIVLTETTSSNTGLVTLSPQSNITETQTTDGNFKTSTTLGISTINTTSTMRDLTLNHSQHNNVPTTSPNDTQLTSTLDPRHFNTSSNQKLSTSTLSDQSAASNLSTTLSHNSTIFSPTQETRNDSRGDVTKNADYPEPTPTLSTENTTIATEEEDTAGVRSHVLVLIIILLLVLITVGGFLYRRHIVKQRMDLPPPFKPPPPPVKYTAARQQEINTQRYPTSRCNSVNEFEDVKLNLIA